MGVSWRIQRFSRACRLKWLLVLVFVMVLMALPSLQKDGPLRKVTEKQVEHTRSASDGERYILLAITLRRHVQADVRASFLNHARFPEAPWVENARHSAFVTVKKPKLPARRWPLHPGFISNIKGKYRTRDVTFYCLTVSVSDLQTHFNNGTPTQRDIIMIINTKHYIHDNNGSYHGYSV